MTLSYIIQAFVKLCHVPASRHQETPRQTDNYNAQMFAAIPFAMATPQVSRILNISRELETSREIPATYREALESRLAIAFGSFKRQPRTPKEKRHHYQQKKARKIYQDVPKIEDTVIKSYIEPQDAGQPSFTRSAQYGYYVDIFAFPQMIPSEAVAQQSSTHRALDEDVCMHGDDEEEGQHNGSP